MVRQPRDGSGHRGFAQRWEHWRLQADELAVVIYSLDKAVRLLLKSNQNIVGLLWLRDDEYVHRHETFALLRRRRAISSQAAADSFAGYAYDQLKRNGGVRPRADGRIRGVY